MGTTAHKLGRVAGENSVGGNTLFPGAVGTQVVRSSTWSRRQPGLRDEQAKAAGYQPHTVAATADDHKAYYPGAQPIHMRLTGDTRSGLLLGAQLVGGLGSQIAKRVDILATALAFQANVIDISGLDLSHTPPLGSPYDAVQHAALAWSTPRPAVEQGSAGSRLTRCRAGSTLALRP